MAILSAARPSITVSNVIGEANSRGDWDAWTHHDETVWPFQISRASHAIADGFLNIDRQCALWQAGEPAPLVSCLMVTKGRFELARRAVTCFRAQTYSNLELVIVDDGGDRNLGRYIESLDDDRIRYHDVLPNGQVLGELRNLTLELARGVYLAQWDDDDLSDPDRIAVQVAAILEVGAEACLLSRVRIWWPQLRQLALSPDRAWEGSMVYARQVSSRYPIIARGEDTPVVARVVAEQFVVSLDAPSLYTYIVHGKNTWHEEHFKYLFGVATELADDSDYPELLEQMASRLPIETTSFYTRGVTGEPEMSPDGPASGSSEANGVVLVGDRTYRPVAAPPFGIGITTRNRPGLLAETVAKFRRYTPGALIVVVDDASDVPVVGASFRFEEQAGIAVAKNKCIELLMDAGCTDLVLVDDDCYPIVYGWWKPYVESPEPHLASWFDDVTGDGSLDTPSVVYEDDRLFAYSTSPGRLLYVRRSVVERVGGLRTEFGIRGAEHIEWSDRIHAAGFTSFPYMAVKGGDRLIYSLDVHSKKHPGFESSVEQEVREGLDGRNRRLLAEFRGSTDFVPYREGRDVVVTSLLTGRPDPQTESHLAADVSLIAGLRSSLRGAQLVVCHDELTAADTAETVFVRSANAINVYFQRHVSAWQYLRANPDVRWVWCVDGTDVKMLHEPWPHMQPGKLYLGSENTVVDIPWMRYYHRAALIQDFIETHGDRQMLNAGLIGGDRATVMSFLHDLISAHVENGEAVGPYDHDHKLDIGDVAAVNLVAWTRYADCLMWGSMVNTVFGASEDNEFSWWQYK